MAGLDSTGFTSKSLDEVRESLKQRARNKYGPEIDTGEQEILGIFLDIHAEEIAEVWSGGQSIYDGFNPSKAEGVPQDDGAELVGVQRLGAARSTTTAIATGTLGVTVTEDSVVSVTNTGSEFTVNSDETFSLTDPTALVINVDSVLNSTTYTVTINGTAISFTSDTLATLNEITSGLAQSINFSAEQEKVSATDNGNGTLTVSSLVATASPAITNFLLHSEDITNAAWVDVETPVITANDAQFVDGQVVADKIEDNASGEFEGKSQTVTITNSSDSYVVSCFLKTDTLNTASLRLRFSGGTTLEGKVTVDIDTQTVTETGNVFTGSAVATPLADGWVRLSFRMNDNGTGNTSALVEITAGDTASATGAIHVCGFQLERGVATVSDYVSTTTTQETRDATVAATSQVPDSFAITFGSNLSAGQVSTKVVLTAVDTGVVSAPVNTLVNIGTPIFGWSSITNPDAATLGRAVESNTSFRQRRNESVQIAGAGTRPAVEANIRQIEGVTDAFVIENRTIMTDAAGRPGKSFETIVQGGLDSAIGQRLWDVKPLGIETFGNVTVPVVDSQNAAQNVNFSRPTQIWCHLQIDYTKYNEESFPTLGGEDAIKRAALEVGSALRIGGDVILQRFFGQIYNDVSGIATLTIRIAVSATEFGAPGAFSATNLAIGATEISNFSIARMVVTEV